jgi:hypothetical protein
MHVVVNHLHFRDPVTEATVEATRDALRLVIDAGGIAARVVKVDDRHLILLLDFRSAEDADRAAREAGGPWMREHISPLLSGGTERSLGEVIAPARHDACAARLDGCRRRRCLSPFRPAQARRSQRRQSG